jgi:G3E family GTPase
MVVTGFFGSGKTTFLQEDLKDREGLKRVTVFNDQGQFQVNPAGSFSGSYRLSMGSSFLQTIQNLLAYDYILVETSGLAQASVLHRLGTTAEARSDGRLQFRGMICVIDTLRFLKLISTVASLYEQVIYADCFVLSKIDLAEKKDLPRIQAALKAIRPQAPIFIRDNPAISFSTMLSAIPVPSIRKPRGVENRIPELLRPSLTSPEAVGIRELPQYA